MSDEILRDLARRAGIAVEWQDYAGRPRRRRATGFAPRAGRSWASRRYQPRTVLQPATADKAQQPGRSAAFGNRGGRPPDAAGCGRQRGTARRTGAGTWRGRGRSHCCRRAGGCAFRRSRKSVITGCVWRIGRSCWRCRRRDAARSRMSFRMHGCGVWRHSFMA